MTEQHTPTPWAIRSCDRFEGGEPVTEIYSTVTNEVIANDQTYYPQAVKPKNSRLIVQACNAHEELLAALERLLPAREWSRPGEAADGSIFCWVCVNTQAEGHAADCKIGLARAAIARATSPQAR